MSKNTSDTPTAAAIRILVPLDDSPEARVALPYAAALVGGGSQVLGYDTPMSTDHDWGPAVTLFLPEDEAGRASTSDSEGEA